MENQTPQYLYKILSPEHWEESELQDHVVNAPIDRDFIHLATKEQVSHVIKKFWDKRSYVILKLDTKKLKGRLLYETNPGGMTHYYHLYEGSIPLNAVVDSSTHSA